MKRGLPRFLLPFVALLSIPFIYNSCQGNLPGGKSFNSKGNCKLTSVNGVVTTVKTPFKPDYNPFAAKKTLLRGDSAPAAFSKPDGSLKVPAGTELGVIVNNQCLQENRDLLGGSVISKAAMDAGGMLAQLDTQAYVWILDRDYTDDEIDALANQETCIVGVSWNREYKSQSISNDTYLSNQTYLQVIRAPEAYDRFYAASSGGLDPAQITAPVLLADIDTGIDWSHPDLQANVWTHSLGVGIDITTLSAPLVNYNPFDISPIGHGTHTSGMMAAVANNGMGIAGAMPYRAKIMAIKVFKLDASSKLVSSSTYVYNGVKFAYLNGATAINLSLSAISSGATRDSLYDMAFEEAINAGAVITVALGNADAGANGADVDGTTLTSLPAYYATKNGAIGVGSIDTTTGNKSSFSHYSTVYGEIAAPGAEAGTTGLVSTVTTALGGYARLAGTSQATPLVTSAAGLTSALIKKAYGIAPTPAEVERLIEASAVKSPALTSYFKDGNRLDYLSLVQKINTDYPQTYTASSPTPTPTPAPKGGCN